MANKIRKSGKKNRKWGRNKIKCERYRKEDRREKNKVLRLARNKKRNKRLAVLRAKREKLKGAA